jgi:molybdenum cofactor biosynthesis enzyme MoaA
MVEQKPTVKFLVTARCNIRCAFCHNEFQGDGGEVVYEMFDPLRTTALLRALSQEGKFADLKISGGEPLIFMDGLKTALLASARFEFDRKILVSNLLAGNVDTFALLKQSGVSELRINVPSFSASGYQSLTGTSKKSFSVLLKRIELARKFGFYLRANTVICNTSLDLLRQEFGAVDTQTRLWDLFDELYLIADYRSPNRDLIEREMTEVVQSMYGASLVTKRKGRILEYRTRGNRKVSIARCTVTEAGDGAAQPRDFYIRPPGMLMTEFVPGFSYQ